MKSKLSHEYNFNSLKNRIDFRIVEKESTSYL